MTRKGNGYGDTIVVLFRGRGTDSLSSRSTNPNLFLPRSYRTLRDGAIVARHERPGEAAKKSCPVAYGLIRSGAHRFDDWSDEVSNTNLRYFTLATGL
jgi:hypothetical protein